MQIYKTTNLINGKIYIGQDSKISPTYFGSGTYYKKAEAKYGKENFVKEILEDAIDSYEELDAREIYWISFYNATDRSIGYNVQPGGRGWSKKVLDEYWNKHNVEEQERITFILNNSEIDNPTLDYEVLKKDRLSRNSIIESFKLPVQKTKNTLNTIKKVYQYDIDGNLLDVYENLDHAFRSLDGAKTKSNLSAACNGHRNFCYGYRWSYSSIPNSLHTVKKVGRLKGTKDSSKRKRQHVNTVNQKILQFDLNNVLIYEWCNATQASITLGVSKQMILRRSKTNSIYKGFIWKQGEKTQITKQINN
jgi:hypothetical protein